MIHFPVTLTFGHQHIPLHGIMETLGIFIGFRYYLLLRKKQGDVIESEHRIWIIIAAMMGSVLGARIVGTLEDIPAFLSSANKLSYFWGNKTLLGGLFGGLLAVEGVKKVIGEKQATGDLFVYPLLLAMIIGRIGCFSAGVYEETYGIPSSLPWAMDLGDGLLRHPVTIYEIIYLIALWTLLKILSGRYSLAQGALFKMMMIGYFVFRLLLDFIKPGWRYFGGMGSIQVASIVGLAYYYRYLLNPRLLLTGKRTLQSSP